jgi:hypothetical protein
VTTTAAAAGTRRHTGTYPAEPRQVGLARAALAGWLGGWAAGWRTRYARWQRRACAGTTRSPPAPGPLAVTWAWAAWSPALLPMRSSTTPTRARI